MLLDGVGVGGALTGTDDLIGKALGDGLDVPEGPREHLCAAAGWSESPGGDTPTACRLLSLRIQSVLSLSPGATVEDVIHQEDLQRVFHQ